MFLISDIEVFMFYIVTDWAMEERVYVCVWGGRDGERAAVSG